MHLSIFLIDFVYIAFVVVGACIITALQLSISGSFVHRLGRKVGPDYWGRVYGSSRDAMEPTIPLYPPAREMESNYGRRS